MRIETEDLVGIIGAFADLAWPLLSAAVLWKVLPTLLKVANSRGFRVKVGGMEITVQDATEQLGRSVGDLQRKVGELRAGSRREGAPPEAHRLLASPRVAWVDDAPGNNAYEIARLRQDGVTVLKMLSTRDAVHALVEEGRPVDVVISDMGRLEGGTYNRRAGLELIRALRAESFDKAIYVYCSSESAERMREEIERAGAQGITSSQVELFDMLRREGLP